MWEPGVTIHIQDSVAGPKVTENACEDPAHICAYER